MSRLHPLLLTALLSVVVASGCQTVVRTEINPDSSGSYEVEASVVFDGELAEQIRTETETSRRVDKIIADATGTNPARQDDADTVRWRTKIDSEHLAAATGLTGVASVKVSTSEATTEVHLELVSPERLIAAINTVPDAGGAQAMLAQTTIEVAVIFKGGVSELTTTGNLDARESDAGVTVAHRLDNPAVGTLTVSGSTKSGPSWVWVLAAASVIVVAAIYARRWLKAVRRPSDDVPW